MKIWDVLKELAGNPELTFKNLRFGGVIGHKESGTLVWISGSDRIGEAFTIHHIDDGIAGGNWNDDWELVPQEVTFMEAFNAWREGKTITIHRNNLAAWASPSTGTYQISKGNCENVWWYANDIAYGKWYIK